MNQAVFYETVPLQWANSNFMTNLSALPVLLFLLAAFVSCKGEASKKEKADDLQTKVEEIHDVAMAKIGTIRYFQDTLTAMIASNESDSAQIRQLTICLQSVKNADDQMMEWMRNYKSNNEEMEDDERLDYLKGEEQKVIMVRDSIERSIAKVRSVMEKM